MAKCAPWKFGQNNTVMLTYMHNHAPGILLWQCFCHRTEKNSRFSSFQRWFLSMTSLAVTSSMLKFSVKFGGTSFKFCLRPYNTGDSIKIYHLLILRIAVHGEAPNIFCQFCVVLYVAYDSLKQYWIYKVYFEAKKQ